MLKLKEDHLSLLNTFENHKDVLHARPWVAMLKIVQSFLGPGFLKKVPVEQKSCSSTEVPSGSVPSREGHSEQNECPNPPSASPVQAPEVSSVENGH